MRSITHVQAEHPFGAPQRPRPRIVSALPAPRPVDLDEQGAPRDEHEDISSQALANLAHELQHSEAEVNSLIQAGVLGKPDDVADPLQRHERIIGDIDQELEDVLAEGRRLQDAAERLKAKYREAAAPLIEEMRAQKRREAELRREYERRIVRMQPKRSGRKRA